MLDLSYILYDLNEMPIQFILRKKSHILYAKDNSQFQSPAVEPMDFFPQTKLSKRISYLWNSECVGLSTENQWFSNDIFGRNNCEFSVPPFTHFRKL